MKRLLLAALLVLAAPAAARAQTVDPSGLVVPAAILSNGHAGLGGPAVVTDNKDPERRRLGS